jgi:hypothetical protein
VTAIGKSDRLIYYSTRTENFRVACSVQVHRANACRRVSSN